jgi:hypothetical protein
MPNRSARVLFPFVAGALLLAGCSSEKPGTAQPAPTSVQPPSGTGAPSAPGGATTASLDPCTLLAAADLSAFGKFGEPEKVDLGGGARACRFIRERATASDDTLTADVIVRDTQSLDSTTDQGGGKAQGDVKGRQAFKVPIPPTGCTIAMAVGQSRVDVATVSTDTDKACDVAEKTAELVEPKLPKG